MDLKVQTQSQTGCWCY